MDLKPQTQDSCLSRTKHVYLHVNVLLYLHLTNFYNRRICHFFIFLYQSKYLEAAFIKINRQDLAEECRNQRQNFYQTWGANINGRYL